MTQPIQAITSIENGVIDSVAQLTKTPSTNFSHWVNDQVQNLDQTLKIADASATQLVTGTGSNLHQVMLNMEEAKIAFQLAVQVRNRVIEAYQDITKMQI